MSACAFKIFHIQLNKLAYPKLHISEHQTYSLSTGNILHVSERSKMNHDMTSIKENAQEFVAAIVRLPNEKSCTYILVGAGTTFSNQYLLSPRINYFVANMGNFNSQIFNPHDIMFFKNPACRTRGPLKNRRRRGQEIPCNALWHCTTGAHPCRLVKRLLLLAFLLKLGI